MQTDSKYTTHGFVLVAENTMRLTMIIMITALIAGNTLIEVI